jgi:hypothetical protein
VICAFFLKVDIKSDIIYIQMFICAYPYGTAKKLHQYIYGGSKMGKCYIVTNPKDVVEIGRCELIMRISAGISI